MNPMAIADSGASHVILPQTALYDAKVAKPVSLRRAAGEITAVEARREIFAKHVTIHTTLPIRTCNLDTPNSDFELCEHVGNGARPCAMSYQRRHALLHCGAILDSLWSSSTQA